MTVPKFTSGPEDVTRVLNELVTLHNKLRTLTGDKFIKVSQVAGGTSFGLNIDQVIAHLPRDANIENWFLALVGGGTDARYTVTEQEITSSDTDTLTYGTLDGGRVVTATNLAEVVTQTTNLDAEGFSNQRVIVFELLDNGEADRYVFYCMGDNQPPSVEDVEAIGRTPEGTEAADDESWDRSSPMEDKFGMSFNVITNVGYFEGGDEILYGYYKTITVDNFGRISSMSAETRYEINAPDAC